MLTCSSPCATHARTSSKAFGSLAAAGGITNSFLAESLFAISLFSDIAFSDLTQHIVTVDAQRIHSGRAQGIAELCSGLRIEAPAMPPAYHPAILDRAIGERRATMRTLVVQSRKLPADPCHAD